MTSRAVAASLYRCWKKHPRKNADLKKRSDHMQRCCDYLVFGDVVNQVTGEVTRKLQAAEFCRDRLCPMCSWRKSLVTFSQLSDIMLRIDSTTDGLVPIFLTLTMRNCGSSDLADCISRELRAWSRMVTSKHRRKPWRIAVGWFRALEITYNKKDGTWHPHIHAILLVRPDYFDKKKDDYISQEDWIAEWRWALGVDYDPSVDVRTVKGGQAKAIAEVAKYTVKPGEWLDLDDGDGTDERVELLARVLKGRRLTAFGGLMKETRKVLKQEDAETADLVRTGDDATMRGDLVTAMEKFEWQIGVTNYVSVGREEV
jgi:plasmid rolling circle replication initiator protein Rep